MRRLLTLLFLSGAVAMLAPAAASADGALTLRNFGTQYHYDSDSQDAENLVISLTSGPVQCGAAVSPCIQFANGPQNVRDEAAGCEQVISTVVACNPAGISSIFLKLDDGDDFAVVNNSLPRATMEGSFDSDNLSSGSGNDIIRGGPDNDDIFDDDNSADDTIDGGDGDDSISLTGGDDDVVGGAGTDTVEMDSTDDTVTLDDVANDGPAGRTKNIHSDVEIVDGFAGSDNLIGNAAANNLIGGSGNDLINGGDGADVLEGGSGADELNGGGDVDRVVYTNAEGQNVTLDDVRNDGGAADPGLDNVHSDIEDVAAGAGNDQVTGSGAANVLDGGDGDDRVEGGGGVDTLFGGAGADQMFARDGLQERVECGSENDTGEADTIDFLVDCEGVVVTSDLVPDVDGDGSNKPLDCDDGNAAIHPGARDVPRNGVDEDCSGKDAKFKVLRASISFRFSLFSTHTELDRYRAVQLIGGEKIKLRCKGPGCPFKKKKVKAKRAGSRNLKKFVRNARFRKGAVLEAFITKPETVGRYRKLKFRDAKPPKLRKRCIQPGAKKPSKCTGG